MYLPGVFVVILDGGAVKFYWLARFVGRVPAPSATVPRFSRFILCHNLPDLTGDSLSLPAA